MNHHLPYKTCHNFRLNPPFPDTPGVLLGDVGKGLDSLPGCGGFSRFFPPSGSSPIWVERLMPNSSGPAVLPQDGKKMPQAGPNFAVHISGTLSNGDSGFLVLAIYISIICIYIYISIIYIYIHIYIM